MTAAVARTQKQKAYDRRVGLARARLFAHVVEGKRLTSREIAEVIGTRIETACTRAKRGPFPLTWASLKSARSPSNRRSSAHEQPPPLPPPPPMPFAI